MLLWPGPAVRSILSSEVHMKSTTSGAPGNPGIASTDLGHHTETLYVGWFGVLMIPPAGCPPAVSCRLHGARR